MRGTATQILSGLGHREQSRSAVMLHPRRLLSPSGQRSPRRFLYCSLIASPSDGRPYPIRLSGRRASVSEAFAVGHH